MDASKFLRESDRMCRSYENCDGCPGFENACYQRSEDRLKKSKGVVATVEQWAKDHPIKTRQSEFLKMFPNADLTRLLPCHVEKDKRPMRCAKYGYLSITCRCDRCRDDYWNEEVSE